MVWCTLLLKIFQRGLEYALSSQLSFTARSNNWLTNGRIIGGHMSTIECARLVWLHVKSLAYNTNRMKQQFQYYSENGQEREERYITDKCLYKVSRRIYQGRQKNSFGGSTAFRSLAAWANSLGRRCHTIVMQIVNVQYSKQKLHYRMYIHCPKNDHIFISQITLSKIKRC